MTIKVVLVDDQSLVRTGLRMVLGTRADIEIVGEAADGSEALDVVGATAPDVVLMDIRMPVMDGIAATRAIVESGGPKVLVLTTFDFDEYVFEALQAGASGFLIKDAPVAELVSAIVHVHGGDCVVAPTVTRRLIEHFTAPPRSPRRVLASTPEQLSELTPRELEVLGLVAAGLSNSEIAAAIVVSEATVKAHVGGVLSKLGLRDRTQAVIAAYEAGIAGAVQRD